MSVSINVSAYSDKNNPEFLKHFKAVKFCIENKLSYPKETEEFFEGKIQGDDLSDYNQGDWLLNYLSNGVEVELPTTSDPYGNEIRIKVSDIPPEAEEIVIKLT